MELSSGINGRAGHSASLGSFVEYPLQWRAALWPLLPCLLIVAYLSFTAATAPAVRSCGLNRSGVYYCTSQTADTNRQGAGAMAVIISGLGLLYFTRRVLHAPWLRVGDQGIEDRSTLFGIVRVNWSDVLAIPEASTPWALNRYVFVRVKSSAGPDGDRGWVRIRVSGMAATTDEIQDEMDAARRRFHQLPNRPRQTLTATNKRVLKGIEIETAKDTWSDLTQADLHHLIERTVEHEHLMVYSTARGEDHFIQATYEGGDVWDLEYRDGSPDRQFAAQCMTNTEVFHAFAAWIGQNPKLPHLLSWHPVRDLEA